MGGAAVQGGACAVRRVALGQAWRLLAMAACVSLAAACARAHASEESVDVQPGGVADMDHMTVTARRREESSQSIGISMATLYREQLERGRIDTMARVADSIPNVTLFDVIGGGVPTLIIRGVGVQDYSVNNSPAATLYIDEVYQTSTAMAGNMLFDLERVEVLKGPQGGLYGRNTTGGAVQVISRQPQFDRFEAYASYGLGRYSTQELEGAWGGPLTDDLAVRVAGRAVVSDDTWTRSVATGRRHGEQKRWAGRALLRWVPRDDLEVGFKLHGGWDESEPPLVRTIGTWVPGDNLVPGVADGVLFNYGGLAPSLEHVCEALRAGFKDNSSCASQDGRTPASKGLGANPHDVLGSNVDRLGNDWQGASFKVDRAVDVGTLTSISAYDRYVYGRRVDIDGLIEKYQDVDLRANIRAWSQEFRLTSTVGGLFDWIAGVSAAGDRFVQDGFLHADTGFLPLVYPGFRGANLAYDQDTRSYAGFGSLGWQWSDALRLVGDLRYTYEEKRFSGGTYLLEPRSAVAEIDDRKRYDDFSGKIAAEWMPSDHQLAYLSLSRGFKSGGFFGGFAADSAQLEPYEPETVLAWEVGYKAVFPERALRVNFAAFRYEIDDYQGFAHVPSGPALLPRLSNLGEARIRGWEGDLVYAGIERWELQAGLGYLDGEITRSAFETSDVFAAGLHPVAGLRLPNYSTWTGRFVARHVRPVAAGLELAAQLEYSFASRQDLGLVSIPEEKALFRESAHGLVNLRAQFGRADGRWRVGVWIENLADERYRTTARTDAIGGVYEIYGPPRTFGLTVAVLWE